MNKEEILKEVVEFVNLDNARQRELIGIEKRLQEGYVTDTIDWIQERRRVLRRR